MPTRASLAQCSVVSAANVHRGEVKAPHEPLGGCAAAAGANHSKELIIVSARVSDSEIECADKKFSNIEMTVHNSSDETVAVICTNLGGRYQLNDAADAVMITVTVCGIQP